MVEMQNVQQSYPYEIAIVLFPENTKHLQMVVLKWPSAPDKNGFYKIGFVIR